MTEEERKQKYRNLLYRVNSINTEISKLNSDLIALKENLQENFKINNEYICQDEINSMITTSKSVSNELKNTVIPHIRYRT